MIHSKFDVSSIVFIDRNNSCSRLSANTLQIWCLISWEGNNSCKKTVNYHFTWYINIAPLLLESQNDMITLLLAAAFLNFYNRRHVETSQSISKNAQICQFHVYIWKYLGNYTEMRTNMPSIVPYNCFLLLVLK